ncbi:MAG: BlaI/MecI/CopY family transcriptional regulator [Mycobacterium sp.]|uniref:BlaI/MecI/CopY family transcriptional regulator n=1 Tax=Mycobacterium sp. TaxID=1785 RepID=UPI002615CCFB|nr:BlaI/MecI/CopY family transcriptional regulator [Mycobacterium sp.]MDI3313140.1 BlaI/MecI/CopY family transcriptional regulator [Mycobacterium sp.]
MSTTTLGSKAAVRVRQFGDLEAVIMDRMWSRGEVATVREVFTELAEHRRIAYTTVLSTMDNLHRKGWLQRSRVGKAFHYWPTMTREEHSAALMREVFGAGGDPDLVLTHFLSQLGREESMRVRATLRRLIDGRNPT